MKLWKKLTAAVLMSAAMLGAGLTAKPLLPVLTGAEITAQAWGEKVTVDGLVFTKYYSYANVTGCSDYSAATIIIPAEVDGLPVTGIGMLAFNDNTSLASVSIPDSVTSIGMGAFQRCTSLTSITIPISVTTIGNCAFFGCTGLTSITIPDQVTSIIMLSFAQCTGLTSITIPDSVKRIGRYAFYDCTGLTSVTIPDSVTSIEDGAFRDCTGLISITIPESVTGISADAFDGCTDLTIWGIAGSYAEEFANENNIPFESVYAVPVTSVTLSKNHFPYTGKQVKVGSYISSVMSGSTKLKYGTDFTLSYSNNVKCGIGTASVTVIGIGNYSGSVTKYYSILPAKQAKPKLSTLNGKLHVEWAADANAEGYQVQYCKDASFTGDTLHNASFTGKTFCNLAAYPKNGETWYVRVRSYMKNKAGTNHGYWSDAASVTLGKIDSVTLSQTEFAYTGKEIKVGSYIKVKSGTTALKYETDFTLVYKNNVNKGTATVTVKGIGEYAGSSVTKTYKIK